MGHASVQLSGGEGPSALPIYPVGVPVEYWRAEKEFVQKYMMAFPPNPFLSIVKTTRATLCRRRLFREAVSLFRLID